MKLNIPETNVDRERATEKSSATSGAKTDFDTPIREAGQRRSSFGKYLQEISTENLLSPDQEVELAGLIEEGDEIARETMIKSNLRLVVKIARDYENFGLPLLDLINEGNMGLMRAVEKFDPDKGAKFSTYSSFWIKQSIKRALANQSKTIRLPVHLVDKIYHMRKAQLRLHEELGREPNDMELAEELGLKLSQIRRMRRASMRPASLDAPIGDEDTNRLADIVKDEKARDPFETLEFDTSSLLVQELLPKLPEREIRILGLRFGLNGEERLTLEEIGEIFGVTRERIRQLQNNALRKLRKMIEEKDKPSKEAQERMDMIEARAA